MTLTLKIHIFTDFQTQIFAKNNYRKLPAITGSYRKLLKIGRKLPETAGNYRKSAIDFAWGSLERVKLSFANLVTLDPLPFPYYTSTSNGWCFLIVKARPKFERFSFKKDNRMLYLGRYHINNDVLSVFM